MTTRSVANSCESSVETDSVGPAPCSRTGLRCQSLQGQLGLALLGLLVSGSLDAQLTAGGNVRWNQDHFPGSSLGEDHDFGHALAVCDFDGDGFDDLAISSPGSEFAIITAVEAAGLVHILYGSEDGLSNSLAQSRAQNSSQDPPEEGDRFGEALAAGDFDGDGFCDLAVGTPLEDLNDEFEELEPIERVGVVHIYRGSSGGLELESELLTQGSTGGLEVPEEGDLFGRALVAGDVNGDGLDDLAVGVYETFDGPGAPWGAVHLFLGTQEGLVHSEMITEVDLLLSRSGPFGQYLALAHFDDDPYADLVVGGHWSVGDSGRAWIVMGSEDGFDTSRSARITQETEGVGLVDSSWDRFGKSLAPGDFDGDGLDELVVGFPDTVFVFPPAWIDLAGAFVVLDSVQEYIDSGSPLQSQYFRQGAGLADEVEESDECCVVAAGDFDKDGYDDLAAGVPREDFEALDLSANGTLHVLYGGPNGLSSVSEQFDGQGGWGLGLPEDGDWFGSTLISGDFDDDNRAELAVAAIYEDLQGETNAGLVGVITGRDPFPFSDGFEFGDLRLWNRAIGGPEN